MITKEDSLKNLFDFLKSKNLFQNFATYEDWKKMEDEKTKAKGCDLVEIQKEVESAQKQSELWKHI